MAFLYRLYIIERFASLSATATWAPALMCLLSLCCPKMPNDCHLWQVKNLQMSTNSCQYRFDRKEQQRGEFYSAHLSKRAIEANSCMNMQFYIISSNFYLSNNFFYITYKIEKLWFSLTTFRNILQKNAIHIHTFLLLVYFDYLF